MPSSRRHLLVSLLAAALPWSRAAASPSPALPLLGVWPEGLDPAAFLVSEKYDGVRGVWDGTQLRHRSGRPVSAPAWFSAQLPRTPLDGELWLGRGRFDELSGIVRKEQPVDAEWRQVRYMVFELPGAPDTFAKRARRIEGVVRQNGSAQLVAVDQSPIADRAALQQRLALTIAQGGEGLVLHRADAAWVTGRSDAILKLKPALDTEAMVVAHHAGRGKYAGLLGALEVRTPEGRQFLIGSGLSDALRRDPPPIGSVVTYRYRDLTSTGLPRFATFVRMHTVM
ncbi:MAG: DNA ligase [Burkholderiales bacterium]